MNEWKEYTVQDLIDQGMLAESMDGNHGSIHPKSSDYVSEGVPFIMANDLVNGVVDLINCSFISEKQAKTLKKGFAHPNDVLLTHKATIGRTAIVPNKYETIILTPQVTYYRVLKGIDNRYLKYYFDSDFFQNTLRNWAGSGSTRAYIGITAQRKLPIILPPLNVQTKIATVLALLDEKISLNIAINENLEQQAYLLLEQMLSIPHDDVCCLSDIANINPRYTLSKGTEARYIDMSQLSTTTSFPDGWTFRAYNGGMKFKNQDTIMARITPCLENGKTAYIDFLANDEIAFGSTEYIVLSPKDNIPPELLYCIVRNPDFRSYATVNMNGSSGRQRVSGEIIGKYELPQFTEDELAYFGSVACPLFKQITENSLQNRNLSALRDTLLPKLMNGEIDVSEVKV